MIILYTIDCPKCKVLERKLESNCIEFDKCYDIELMKSKGFTQTPQLEVDGKIMDFSNAIKWLNNK